MRQSTWEQVPGQSWGQPRAQSWGQPAGRGWWNGWGVAPVQLRVGDDERESAVAALGEHYSAGRLTLEEYDQRTSHAFAARSTADLARLFCDLPQLPPPPEPRTLAGRLGSSFAPLVLVAIALVVLSQLPWPVMLVVGWIWWSRTFRRWSRSRNGPTAQTSGSRRAVRGTCS